MSDYDLRPVPSFAHLIGEIVQREMRWDHTCSVVAEVDLTNVERVRASAAAAGRPKPSYTAFVVKAVALALREHPCANRRLVKRWWLPFGRPCYQQFRTSDVALGIERKVPDAECVAYTEIVRSADELSLDQITERLRAMANSTLETSEQWRGFHALGTKVPTWLAKRIASLPLYFPSLWRKWRGGAAMISSPGKYGADAVLGTWHCPLGVSFGVVKQRPVVRDGQIVAAPTFVLYLNFDRRLLAGGPAGRFFHSLVRFLENPEPIPALEEVPARAAAVRAAAPETVAASA